MMLAIHRATSLITNNNIISKRNGMCCPAEFFCVTGNCSGSYENIFRLLHNIPYLCVRCCILVISMKLIQVVKNVSKHEEFYLLEYNVV